VLALADVLELKNGQKVEGQFAGGTREEIHFQVGSQTLRYPIAEVARITMGSQSQEDYRKAAREALRQVKALASVVEGGTTYRDYGPRVSDAKIKVDQFLDEFKSSALPMFNAHIADALGFYIAASSAWNARISRSGYEGLARNSFAQKCAPLQQLVIQGRAGGLGGLSQDAIDGIAVAVGGVQPLWECARTSLGEAERALGQ